MAIGPASLGVDNEELGQKAAEQKRAKKGGRVGRANISGPVGASFILLDGLNRRQINRASLSALIFAPFKE